MEYIVKQSDLIGDVAKFPIEIVQVMVNRGLEQGFSLAYTLSRVQRTIIATFAWRQTIEGVQFWRKLIVKHLPAINYILKQVGGFEIFGRLWSSSNGCDCTCALTIDVNCNTKDSRSVNTIAYARAVSDL